MDKSPDPATIQTTQQAIKTLMASPTSIILAFLWLLGIAVLLTWWATRRIGNFATWPGVTKAIKAESSAQAEALTKAAKEHADLDLRMFEEAREERLRLITEMGDRYQRGMEMASEKFTEGMKSTSGYLKDVTEQIEVVRKNQETVIQNFRQIKGGIQALVPEEAKKIFQD